MTLITLTPGMEVEIHAPTGFDDLVALSVRAKIEPFLADLESLRGTWHYQSRFALIVACTDSTKGLPFDLPRRDAEGAALADAFRAWLRLPRRMFRKWFDAMDEIEESYNAPDLVPDMQVDQDTNPLAGSGAPTSKSG